MFKSIYNKFIKKVLVSGNSDNLVQREVLYVLFFVKMSY